MPQEAINVVMVDAQTPEQCSFLEELAARSNIKFAAPQSDDEQELVRLLGHADAVIVQRKYFGQDLLKASPKLKLIQKMGGRRDQIDIQAAKARGIAVALMCLPGSVSVAEHVFSLILALSRKILPAHKWTVEGAYRQMGVEPKVTSERSHSFQWMKMNDMLVNLRGSTLGIIGFGDIGNEVAKRARAFEMQVLYFDKHPLDAELEAELGVRYCPKDDLLKNSDFVSLNIPLSPATEKLIAEPELALMKPSAYLINTCRGGVIDEMALVEALRKHRIAGAGLDVFVQEPVPYDHPYLTLDNVVLTPHIGGGKGGARILQPQSVFNNIQNFFNRQKVEYRIL
jgi:D-3-phosphoglycerate dehydrogenase / 2-oxoglutarate reductase